MTINIFWDYVIIVDVNHWKSFCPEHLVDIKNLEAKRCEKMLSKQKIQQMLLKMKAYGLMKKDY